MSDDELFAKWLAERSEAFWSELTDALTVRLIEPGHRLVAGEINEADRVGRSGGGVDASGGVFRRSDYRSGLPGRVRWNSGNLGRIVRMTQRTTPTFFETAKHLFKAAQELDKDAAIKRIEAAFRTFWDRYGKTAAFEFCELERLSDLEVGDIIRFRGGSQAFVVVAHYGTQVIVSRTQTLTNPKECLVYRMCPPLER